MEPNNDRQGRASGRAGLKASNLETLRVMFAKMAKPLEAALPRFITPERMIRVATTTVQRVPKLLECDPITVIGATMQSAQLGLEPDNVTGAAYLVPFWNSKARRFECNLIPGYRGLMSLARRSKEVAAFDARVVKVGDAFDYEYGSRHFLRHKPAKPLDLIKFGEDGGVVVSPDKPTIAAYSIAFFPGMKHRDDPAGFQFLVMDRNELEKAKQFTKSRNKEGEIVGPWIEHPDPMFAKSVIRRHAKQLPFSVEMQTAVALDERHALGKSQNLGLLAGDFLGVNFDATDEGDDNDAGGESGQDAGEQPSAETVRDISALFTKLGMSEAQRTVKLQEYRNRSGELLEWLKSEAAKPVGNVKTTEATKQTEPATAPTADEIFKDGSATTNATDKPATDTNAAGPQTTEPNRDNTRRPARKPSRGKFSI